MSYHELHWGTGAEFLMGLSSHLGTALVTKVTAEAKVSSIDERRSTAG